MPPNEPTYAERSSASMLEIHRRVMKEMARRWPESEPEKGASAWDMSAADLAVRQAHYDALCLELFGFIN